MVTIRIKLKLKIHLENSVYINRIFINLKSKYSISRISTIKVILILI